MLGTVIGDVAGSLYEFNNTSDYNFRLFARGCSYTDDTICTVAVADAILRGRSCVDGYKESMLKWCRRYPHPMGAYGGMFYKWIFAPGEHRPYGSFGNGAAMRVGPVGWAFDTEAEVIRQAMRTAEVTHNHREGLIGAASVALAIFRLRVRSGQIRTAVPAIFRSDSPADQPAKQAQDAHRCQGRAGQTAGAAQGTDRRDDRSGRTAIATAEDEPLSKKAVNRVVEEIMKTCYGPKWRDGLPPKGQFDGTCQGTVPVAFDVIARSDSFEDAIRNAVSYGGDSDTLGAIVGSIAEACWPIPDDMAATAFGFLPDRMKTVVRDFYARFRR